MSKSLFKSFFFYQRGPVVWFCGIRKALGVQIQSLGHLKEFIFKLELIGDMKNTRNPQLSCVWRHKFKSISAMRTPSLVRESPLKWI